MSTDPYQALRGGSAYDAAWTKLETAHGWEEESPEGLATMADAAEEFARAARLYRQEIEIEARQTN